MHSWTRVGIIFRRSTELHIFYPFIMTCLFFSRIGQHSRSSVLYERERLAVNNDYVPMPTKKTWRTNGRLQIITWMQKGIVFYKPPLEVKIFCLLADVLLQRPIFCKSSRVNEFSCARVGVISRGLANSHVIMFFIFNTGF